MSEKMYPIPFDSLMNWVTSEYAQCGDVFGVHKHYHASGKSLPIFGERIETPFGPAAGPNSQLAQNIIAAYAAGARFFEVKTVQKMDGAELAACVPRPCILAADEGYNQEWSTELTVQQAQDEYIKAWCALKVMSKVYGFGDPDVLSEDQFGPLHQRKEALPARADVPFDQHGKSFVDAHEKFVSRGLDDRHVEQGVPVRPLALP